MQGLDAGAFELRIQERLVEGYIVGDDWTGPNEIPDLLRGFGRGAGVGYVRVRDPMHARGGRVHRALRVDCRVEGVALQPVIVGLAVQRREAYAEQRHRDNPVRFRQEPARFYVYDNGLIKIIERACHR